MKVKVLKPCIDGKTKKHLAVGDIFEISKARFEKAPKGYLEEVEPIKAKKKKAE